MSDIVVAMLVLTAVTLSLYALDAFLYWYENRKEKK